MRFRVAIALLQTCAPAVAHATPPCRYDRTLMQVEAQVPANDVAYRVTGMAKAKGLQRIQVRDPSGDLTTVWPRSEAKGAPRLYKAVSNEALHVMYAVLRGGSPEREYDLRPRVDGTTFRPVSVWWTADALVVEQGPDGAPYPEGGSTADAIRERYGVVLQEVQRSDDGAFAPIDALSDAWTPRRFALLDDALSRLSSQEREALDPITFVRDPHVDVQTEPGQTLRAAYKNGVVALFDASLEGDAWFFTGSPQAPTSRFTRTLLHELGHGLADIANRRGLTGDILQVYAQVPGALEGPTDYGATSPAEGFAEAFAMFHTDPEALQRCLPEVHAWFERGEHLQFIPSEPEAGSTDERATVAP